jgi:hypothetical protein
MSLPVTGGVSVLVSIYFHLCIVASHCCFNWQFSIDVMYIFFYAYLKSICLSSLVRYLFKSFAPFLVAGLLIFFRLSLRSQLYILDARSLSDLGLQKFSQSETSLFIFVIFFREKAFIKVQIIFAFIDHAFDVIYKNSLKKAKIT